MAFSARRRLPCGLLLASIVLLSACKPAQKQDTEQPTRWRCGSTASRTEIPERFERGSRASSHKAHEAGLTDPSSRRPDQARARSPRCRLRTGNRSRICCLRGRRKQTVLELARLNQLGAVGRRGARAAPGGTLRQDRFWPSRSAGRKDLTVLSGGKLGELKNTGVSDAMILEMIQKGDSDETGHQIYRPARTRRRRPRIRLPERMPAR